MNETNLQNLSKLTRMLGADRLLDQNDVEQIRDILIAVLANNKQEIADLTEDTKGVVESLLKRIIDEHDTYIEKAKVEGTLKEIGRNKTVEVIKYKQKSRYFKKNGHRQPWFKVEINGIK